MELFGYYELAVCSPFCPAGAAGRVEGALISPRASEARAPVGTPLS